MDKDKQIQKIPEYPVEKITGKSNLLIRGLQELGLLTKILKLISSGDVLKIQALDGSRTIKSSGNIFRHVFSDFSNLHTSEIAQKTDEIEVLVYEVVKDARVYKMFASLNRNLEQMCLTQNQILEFIDKHKEYKIPLDKHVIYHFLFKANDKVFVNQVCVGLADPDSYPKWFDGPLEEAASWDYPADGHFRVVVPK